MATVVQLLNFRLLPAIAAFLLVGCQLRPNILSAHSQRIGDVEVVELSLRSVDAKRIKSRELYFSVVVASCLGKSEEYPMTPYVDGQRASEFKFATAAASVKLVGRIPARIFDEYRPACAHLRGGGYFTGTLKSAPVAITRVGA